MLPLSEPIPVRTVRNPSNFFSFYDMFIYVEGEVCETILFYTVFDITLMFSIVATW